MSKTPDYQKKATAVYHKKQIDAGYERKSIYVKPKDWPTVQAWIKKLKADEAIKAEKAKEDK